MSAILDTTLGFLSDLVAQHVYQSGTPKPQRRRWNLGATFLVTDDPANEWLDVDVNFANVEGSDDDPNPVATGTEHPGTDVGISRVDHTHRFGFEIPADGTPSAFLQWNGSVQTTVSVGLRIQESVSGPGLIWLDLWDDTVRQASIDFTDADPDIVTFRGNGSTNIALASNIVYLTATSHISIPNDISILNTGGKTLVGSASSGNTVVVGDGGATLVDIGDGATLVDVGGPLAVNTDGGTVAATGSVRGTNTFSLKYRNAANSADLFAIECSGGAGPDTIKLGNSTAAAAQIQTVSGGTIQLLSGVTVFSVTSTLVSIGVAGTVSWAATAASPTWNQALNTTAGAVTAQNMLMQAQGCSGNAGGAAKTAGTLDLFGGLVTGTGSVNTSGGVRIRPGLASGGTVDTIGGIDIEIPIGSGVDNWGDIRLIDAAGTDIINVDGGGAGCVIQSSTNGQTLKVDNAGVVMGSSGGDIAWFGGTPQSKTTITGARDDATSGGALAQLLSWLDSAGFLNDSSTET